MERKYHTHTKLPSENDSMKQYNASRVAIRKSLQELLLNGYIQKSTRKIRVGV